MPKIRIKNESLLARVGEALGSALTGGEVIELIGPLGAGKTTLAKSILKGAGVSGSFSPTFILDAVFAVSGKGSLKEIHHLDLYRLNDPRELVTLGLYDILGNPDKTILIEWADRFKFAENTGKMTIEIKPNDDQSREIKITTTSQKMARLWSNVSSSVPQLPVLD